MKEILLTKGQVAIVDDEDYDQLSQFKWIASYQKKRDCYNAYRSVTRNGKPVSVLMHREILNAPSDADVDHINHQTLDNRRSNLRVCTRSENNMNVRRYKNNRSGFKGVVLHQSGRFRANIRINGRQTHLGYFTTAVEAARAYNKAAAKAYGAFACLNEVGDE